MVGHSYSTKASPDVWMEPHVFQFVPTASGPVTGCHRRESVFPPTLQVFKHTGKLCVSSVCLPVRLSVAQAKQTQLSQPLLL